MLVALANLCDFLVPRPVRPTHIPYVGSHELAIVVFVGLLPRRAVAILGQASTLEKGLGTGARDPKL